jgi:hypothetical protein
MNELPAHEAAIANVPELIWGSYHAVLTGVNRIKWVLGRASGEAGRWYRDETETLRWQVISNATLPPTLANDLVRILGDRH